MDNESRRYGAVIFCLPSTLEDILNSLDLKKRYVYGV